MKQGRGLIPPDRVLVLGLILAFLAFGFAVHVPIEPLLGQTFVLKPGETATIADGKVAVKFESVARDSRCPKGEQCITAGTAQVLLEIAVGSSTPAVVELGTDDDSREADVAGFRISLEDLTPYPVAGRSIRADEYSASLSVHKR